MFRDMLEWRHTFDVDGKVHSWRRELERHRTRRARLCKRFAIEEQICNDKHGIPVRLLRLGVADSAGMIREFGQEAILVDSLSKLEWTHEQIRKAMFRCRKLIRGQIQILDVGDYGDVPNWTGSLGLHSCLAAFVLRELCDLVLKAFKRSNVVYSIQPATNSSESPLAFLSEGRDGCGTICAWVQTSTRRLPSRSLKP
ncbi:sec14l1 [Symbiodinium microadriaticum]|nr:sec14l1 [Symbiodinium microadriaticum]